MFTVERGLLPQIDFFCQLQQLISNFKLVKTNKNISYYNIPAAFDIEVTSFCENGKKRAIMYHWQFGVFNLVTTGRTWNEYVAFISVLKNIMGLSNELRLCVFVHNLPYEFQFIRKWFEWQEVFLLDERKPVYANNYGVEYRCSLKLAGGKSLDGVGKDLQKYKVNKALGDLDYNLLRTPETPLTEKELYYCEMDIRVILSYVQEKIESDGDITRIPLTNTGYVREYCRKQCFKRWRPYHEIMKELTLNSDEYSQLKRAFQGGFTHANAHYTGKILKNVSSHDFTSSYPAVMLLEKFPMSRSTLIDTSIDIKELEKLLLTKCCLFDIELFGVLPKRNNDHPISKSKCWKISGEITDNGRVVGCEYLKTTITEQDYFIYKNFYTWERCEISQFRYYEKNYLPKQFVLSILELYKRKTILKGVDGEEVNYMISKNMANSSFGMAVTDIVRDEFKYIDNLYQKQPKDIERSIEKYNNGKRRFLFYPWGVWITAYARANLFSGIIAVGDDYVYSDTDSIKSLNTKAHSDYFDRYNSQILEKIRKASEYHRIPIDEFSPATSKGKKKTIGIWDYDGEYDEFKTLGAKRYLTCANGKYVITLAGANKKKTIQYLVSSGNPFLIFDDKLKIPPENSGRLTLTYIDDETAGSLVDYTGHIYSYHELSSIHMEPSEYNLSISDDYINYLKGIRDISE